MKKLLPILLLCSILLITLVSAAIPVQINVNENSGVDIAYPKYDVAKIDTAFNLHFHIFNRSDGLLLTNTSASCFLHLYNPSGNHIYQENSSFNSNGVDFENEINETIFIVEGPHAFIITCDAGDLGGFASGTFDVTLNGNERPEGVVKILFFAFFLFILFWAILSFLKVLGHWKDLEVDIIEVATVLGLYFVIFAYQYLAINYLGDKLINDLMELMVIVGAITHVFIPLVAFAASLILNPFRKGTE